MAYCIFWIPANIRCIYLLYISWYTIISQHNSLTLFLYKIFLTMLWGLPRTMCAWTTSSMCEVISFMSSKGLTLNATTDLWFCERDTKIYSFSQSRNSWKHGRLPHDWSIHLLSTKIIFVWITFCFTTHIKIQNN